MSCERLDNHESPWGVWKRSFASIALGLHLVAVFSAPWSAPPPAPLLAEKIASVFRPYTTAAYLGHGYRFFAPDPGPSHIIAYAIDQADGRVISGRVPDPNRHWPRLIYHRHFMLSETLFNLQARLEQLPDPDDVPYGERQALEKERQYAQRLIHRLSRGIAEQLMARRSGEAVRLTLQEHLIPFPEDVLERRVSLDDPELYVERARLGTYRKGRAGR